MQRKFTKRFTGMQNIPYLERLRQLNLERLDVRRLRADLILAYKILFGITGETDISQFFTFCDNLHNTWGHQLKLLATRANRDTKNYFFSNRVIRAWNSLPQSTNFSSLRTFRKSLYGSYLENCCVVCYWDIRVLNLVNCNAYSSLHDVFILHLNVCRNAFICYMLCTIVSYYGDTKWPQSGPVTY